MKQHPFIRSEAAARALALLSSLPGRELHTNELIRRTGTNARAMQRALVRLEGSGVLDSRRVGNLRLWRLERDHPLYASIRDLFARTRGIPAQLETILRADENVKLAFLFGSYVTAQDDPTSDIDVFVVGRPDWLALSKAIAEAGRSLGREIRPVVWKESDLEHPTAGQSAFLETLREAPKIWLVGREREFERGRTRVAAPLARSRLSSGRTVQPSVSA